MPEVFQELSGVRKQLENHFKEMQEPLTQRCSSCTETLDRGLPSLFGCLLAWHLRARSQPDRGAALAPLVRR